MKLFKSALFLVPAIFLAFLLIAKPGQAAQGKSKPDTVSTSGIDFTPIPTAADSIAAAKAMAKPPVLTKPVVNSKAKEHKTLWQIFIAGFIGGFAALLMPCIFPMLPLTVSFFTKKGGTKAKAAGQASLYGLSIIVIYVLVGLVITLIFGSDALNALSTNGIFNFFFFLLLIVFGISFLGAFEITLPNSLANKLDQNSDKGGLTGLFFMAATLVVVSFSCTGPIIGTLLVEAASKGERLGPAIGMFGFSLALAIPFTLFALFPSALKSLPKSGGWLNSVKVVLGLLELAFALKFLSNVDLAYHWNWFDREIFLALWIVIFAVMGFYLLGKLKFSHDSDVSYVSVPRTFLAIIVLSFVVYMIPGMWGAPLKSISAFLPPSSTQDFDLYTSAQLNAGNSSSTASTTGFKGVKKYEAVFHRAPSSKLGLEAFYDYDQALQVAKTEGKPVLIDFTGWNCVNCRKMESTIWTNPEVLKLLRNKFIMAELYVDDKTELDKADQFTSTYSGKKITTLGGKWSDFQASKFNTNSQPFYVIVNSNGDVLVTPQGADYDAGNYISFLNSGISQSNNRVK
ncbi:protein-disulfide reductase DsbD family protein [Mucilaginibacter paludis]|uniref:Cytochrome c biogenesis protein transmembrane region n=1 Tax=Mucilaginibacter paludis DSM 18603 TaxID=714943 RepID=H1Y228_9SPHI|nr:thioredoxin family protein [Mucilaginibacter paludis]EHQ26685.1 cytochrome c biogenesis protein transmembrane region [Mucilaginibacter paludis DSM 18603]